METPPYSELYDTNPLQQRRVDELMRHSYLLTLHEELAQTWERAAAVLGATPEALAQRRAELADLYEEDIGAPPERRRELERRIEAAIDSRRGETLAEILQAFRVQSQNPSSV